MDDEIKYRITKISAALMITVAITFDLFEFVIDWIPVLGTMISFCLDLAATTIFSLWFLMKGVSLGNAKAMARFWLTNVAEFIPIPVLDVGLLTIGIILMIIDARKEDRGEQTQKRHEMSKENFQKAQVYKKRGRVLRRASK